MTIIIILYSEVFNEYVNIKYDSNIIYQDID